MSLVLHRAVPAQRFFDVRDATEPGDTLPPNAKDAKGFPVLGLCMGGQIRCEVARKGKLDYS